MARRDMLAEYFSVHVSPDGMVESLPLLLRDYTPNLDKLPSFLMRLGPQVTHLSGLFSLWIIEIS
jgi:DNA mismatch repair protein MLH1